MAEPNDDLIKQTRETAVVVEDALRSISSKIKDIFEDVLTTASNTSQTFTKSLTKDITSSLNSLAKVSQQLENNQAKLNVGSLKRADIEKQILERTTKIKSLEDQIQIARNSSLVVSQELLDFLEEQKSYNIEYEEHLNKQADKADEINKKIGLTGGILKGFSKIPILGGLIESEKILARIQKEAGKDTSTKFSVFKEGAKGVGLSIMENFTSPFTLAATGITMLVKLIKFFIDAMFAADKRVTDLAKNISVSKDEARALYESFQESKGILDSTLATTKNITEAFNELANLSDFVNIATTKQLDTQIQLTKEIGVQADEALQLQQLFTLNNNEADKGLDIVYDQIAAFANQNKVVADGRKVIADVNKLSSLIKLNFRGNTGEIVKTVLEAKKLGLTLDQITKTQSSLLDFESSISSQIEAELLTGRQINLERARLFALNNDIAGLTEEIAKQNITAASFSRMNALQQESIAKTLGMSAGELGDSLFKQELINKAAGDYTKNLREQAKLLRTQGNLEEANRLEQRAAGIEQGITDGKSFEQAQRSLDAQTQFNTALERAQEIFSDLVTGGTLDSLSDVLINFTKAVDRFFGNQNLKKQALGEKEQILDTSSSLGAAFGRQTSFKDSNLLLKETRPLAFLDPVSETLGDMFKFAQLKDKQGRTIESSFGSKGFEMMLEQQKQTNEYLRQQINKSTDITLNGESLTNGLAKQTYALGS